LKVISRDKLFFNYLYQKSENNKNIENTVEQFSIEKNDKKEIDVNVKIDKLRKEDVLVNLKKVSFKKPLNISTNHESQISKSHRLSESKSKFEEPFNITQISSMLKTSIYSNLLPHVTVSECIIFLISAKINKNKEFGFFLHTKVDKKAEISDSELKRKLESIKYYGPNYSHCLSCKNRNIEFYDSMNLKNSMKLIDYIKQVRIINK
jgi:hypothetical protein